MRHFRNPTKSEKRKLADIGKNRCGPARKVMFKSHEAAMIRAVEIMTEDPAVKGFRSYQCKWCGGWHLTSQI